MTHQPKGGMCVSCIYALRNCSYLPFKDMRPLATLGPIVIVKCTDFKPGKK